MEEIMSTLREEQRDEFSKKHLTTKLKERNFAFDQMKNNCKFREESKELKKCTAAVSKIS